MNCPELWLSLCFNPNFLTMVSNMHQVFLGSLWKQLCPAPGLPFSSWTSEYTFYFLTADMRMGFLNNNKRKSYPELFFFWQAKKKHYNKTIQIWFSCACKPIKGKHWLLIDEKADFLLADSIGAASTPGCCIVPIVVNHWAAGNCCEYLTKQTQHLQATPNSSGEGSVLCSPAAASKSFPITCLCKMRGTHLFSQLPSLMNSPSHETWVLVNISAVCVI